MMVGLDGALNWTIQYERTNHSGQFSTCLSSVRYSVGAIIEGLANITNVTVAHCASTEEEEVGGPNRQPDGDNGGGDSPVYRSRHIAALNFLPGSQDQVYIITT